MTTLTLANEAETLLLAQAVGEGLEITDCLALYGTLGAGKTAFVRGLVHNLQPEGEPPLQVISPTFMLVQEYPVTLPASGEAVLYHIDAYRIENPDECEELGLSEMLNHGICCIEWPQNCADWLPVDAFALTLQLDATNAQQRFVTLKCADDSRHTTIKTIGERFEELKSTR